MYKPYKSVSIGSLLCLFFSWPVLISGTRNVEEGKQEITTIISTTSPAVSIIKPAAQLLLEESNALYDSIQLKKWGLSKKAFEYAWIGYKQLLEERQIDKGEVLSICDFSQSSRRKRLYIIDVAEKKVLVNTYVAHGRNSGGEYARSFSNKDESHKSSLGFYKTRNTYYGDHGLALKIEGLENGINDRADERNIVIHGSRYVGAGYLRSNKFNGRSFGCPAVPAKDTQKVIYTIKDGTCLFIYHPTKIYLTRSRLLNG
jgi:hypothetical protein